jgi:uncharacterized membrane protein SpoIIM required for sporulation
MKKRFKRDKSWGLLALAIFSLFVLYTTFYLLGGLTFGIITVFTLLVFGPMVGYFIAKKNGDEKGMKGTKLLLILATIFNFLIPGWFGLFLIF